MSVNLSFIFDEYIQSAKKQYKENVIKDSRKLNSNNTITDFKKQSIKLLESIFNLRTQLELLHEEYISLIPQTEESSENYLQMEASSSDMMKLCKECLSYINSPKFINQSLAKDVRLHREAVTKMLSLYLKGCEDLSKENLKVKRSRTVKKNYYPVDDSLYLDCGSVNNVDLNFSSKDLETLQIYTEGVYKRLNADFAEKELIEKQIHEIGKMNQTLADNVLEQHHLINQLELTSGHSNLNVEFGNDQIKKAMQNQSNMRFWVIFILLVLALTLLFVDWYRA